jgi:thiol:disulfide interchange protein DsbD
MQTLFRLAVFLLLTLGTPTWGVPWSSAAVAASRQPEEVLTAKAIPDRPAAKPADQLVVAIKMHLEEGWHIQAADTTVSDAIPTTLKVVNIKGAHAGPVQWPKPQFVMFDFGNGRQKVPVYEGDPVAYLPLLLDAGATGEVQVEVELGYQACSNVCLQPTDLPLSATIKIDPAAAVVPTDLELFKAFDPSVFAAMANGKSAENGNGASPPVASAANVIPIDVFGWRIDVKLDSPVSIAILLLIAAVGGFILNFTPCVLPVIPLKIMSISKAAGTPGRSFFLGLMTSLGVVAFWAALGVLIAGVRVLGAVSQLFANPWFGLGVGVFIAIMALGMMGLFTIQLPQAVYSISPKHDTVPGSFLFGVMTAVLGTPCFGPFAGGAAGAATRVPVAVALAIFVAIGAGMAFPYLVLSARPQWVSKIPRTGPASELIKQIMGLLLLAAAAFFLGSAFLGLIAERPYLGPVIHWWFIALFACAAAAWLMIRTFEITRSVARRVSFSLLAMLIGGASLLVAINQTQASYNAHNGVWGPYTTEKLEKALSEHKVVVIDFTAEWCLNCKTLRALVLDQPKVVSGMRAPDVVALEADLTSRTAPGWVKLKDLNEVGIPLLVIYGPGLDKPFKSNAYTPDQVIDTINRARSGGNKP